MSKQILTKEEIEIIKSSILLWEEQNIENYQRLSDKLTQMEKDFHEFKNKINNDNSPSTIFKSLNINFDGISSDELADKADTMFMVFMQHHIDAVRSELDELKDVYFYKKSVVTIMEKLCAINTLAENHFSEEAIQTEISKMLEGNI